MTVSQTEQSQVCARLHTPDPYRQQSLEKIEQLRQEADEGRPVYATGFHHFDKLIGGGLRQGSLTLIASLTGYGKSAFAQNIVLRMVEQHPDVIAVIISVDDTCADSYYRLVANLSCLTIEQVRGSADGLSDKQQMAREQAWQYLASQAGRLHVYGAEDGDEKLGYCRYMSGVRNHLEALFRDTCNASDRRPQLVVVIDSYRNLLIDGDRWLSGNLTARSAWLVSEVKKLAHSKFEPIIIVTEHLRKETKAVRPLLEDIKDSVALVYDASLVLLLWNDNEDARRSGEISDIYHEGIDEEGNPTKYPLVEVFIAKSKMGSDLFHAGKDLFLLRFDPSRSTLSDAEVKDYQRCRSAKDFPKQRQSHLVR